MRRFFGSLCDVASLRGLDGHSGFSGSPSFTIVVKVPARELFGVETPPGVGDTPGRP